MLDVHPPHQPTHTWKDFFIHIATIVVGLLIAVGLEQAVEYVHHAHQRRELREALRRDIEINGRWARRNVDELDGRRHWAMDQLRALEDAGATGPLHMQRLTLRSIWVPNEGVFLAAKQNGEISLLSVGEQNWLNDADRTEYSAFVSEAGTGSRMNSALTELDGLLLDRTHALPSGDLDLSAMDGAERARLKDSLRSLVEATRQFELDNVRYLSYMEYLRSVPADQLEEADSLKRAIEVFKREHDAHIDLNPAFQVGGLTTND